MKQILDQLVATMTGETSKRLFIDLETYSDVDLGECGVYAYCASPVFEILLNGYCIDDGEFIQNDLAQGESISEEFIQMLLDPKVIKVAHNATFERVCFSEFLRRKGTIKGYRFSDQMGTEIITNTFIQTVSSGGALIDEKGVVTGIASRNKKFDDREDLFLPIQEAINSIGLQICGQKEPFIQAPLAVVKPVSTAIDSYKGSKEPAAMSGKKRK